MRITWLNSITSLPSFLWPASGCYTFHFKIHAFFLKFVVDEKRSWCRRSQVGQLDCDWLLSRVSFEMGIVFVFLRPVWPPFFYCTCVYVCVCVRVCTCVCVYIYLYILTCAQVLERKNFFQWIASWSTFVAWECVRCCHADVNTRGIISVTAHNGRVGSHRSVISEWRRGPGKNCGIFWRLGIMMRVVQAVQLKKKRKDDRLWMLACTVRRNVLSASKAGVECFQEA